MSAQLMGLLLALVVAVLLVFPFSGALRRHPAPFYLAAVVVTGVYVWADLTGVCMAPVGALAAVMQKGYLSSLLLAVVMFTGCFEEGSAVRKRLQPVRGELSILSFILIVGHVCSYLPSYLGRFGALLSARANVAASIVLAVALTALFAVLAATSLRCVRRAMDSKVWKAVQRLSYLMVALLVAHIGFMLGRSALVGGLTARLTFVVYLAVVVLYAVLRVAKAVRDGARGRGAARTPASRAA